MLETGQVTKISGTAKQAAKFEKFEVKSEVLEYKPAADVTVKRKAESDDEDVPETKKIKEEDVEETSADVSMDSTLDASTAEGEVKKKKKKKDKSKDADTTADVSMDVSVEEVGEKKKKKKKKETDE